MPLEPELTILYYEGTPPYGLFYLVQGGNWYNAQTLERVRHGEFPTPTGNLIDPIPISNLQEILAKVSQASAPVLVKTTNHHEIVTTDPNSNLLNLPPSIPEDEVVKVMSFKVPDPVLPTEDVPRLHELALPPFNPLMFEELVRLEQQQLPFRHILSFITPPSSPRPPPRRPPRRLPVRSPELELPSVPDRPRFLFSTMRESESRPSPTPSFTSPATENLKQSLETLLRQLYSLPVEMPDYLSVGDIQAEVIPYERAAQLLKEGKVARTDFDPLVQPWAGPPSTPNRMMTFFTSSGMTYVSKVRYDPTTRTVYPPV